MGCQENLERKIELFSMGTTLKFLKVLLNFFCCSVNNITIYEKRSTKNERFSGLILL